MKFLLSILVLLLIVSFSQTDSISLKQYCPTEIGQEGALCFAYAPVYTALSIAHNVKNKQTNENSPGFKVFSYGFVASIVKKNKSFTGHLFNRCGRRATASLSLGVLLNTGTVLYSDFPMTCDCRKTDDFSEKASQYKIKDTAIISSPNPLIHLENIKNELKNKKAVITTIYQEKFFYKNNGNYAIVFPQGYKQRNISANHVVCIVGFNDTVNGGSFLVKNNYKSWGKDGFSYVKYSDFLKLIRTSYTIII